MCACCVSASSGCGGGGGTGGGSTVRHVSLKKARSSWTASSGGCRQQMYSHVPCEKGNMLLCMAIALGVLQDDRRIGSPPERSRAQASRSIEHDQGAQGHCKNECRRVCGGH